MSKIIIDKIGSIFFIIFGLIFVLFHRRMAYFAINQWMKHLRMNMSEMTYKVAYLCIGIMFVMLGILSLFGWIYFR